MKAAAPFLEGRRIDLSILMTMISKIRIVMTMMMLLKRMSMMMKMRMLMIPMKRNTSMEDQSLLKEEEVVPNPQGKEVVVQDQADPPESSRSQYLTRDKSKKACLTTTLETTLNFMETSF